MSYRYNAYTGPPVKRQYAPRPNRYYTPGVPYAPMAPAYRYKAPRLYARKVAAPASRRVASVAVSRPSAWYNRGGKVSRSVGKIAGAALGGPIGAYLGASAGQYLHSLTGLGDYRTIRRNTLINRGKAPPAIRNSKTGNTIIRHREYIGDVLSSINFNSAAIVQNGQTLSGPLTINPANNNTFPWLSQIASNYQEYRMNGMIFEFKSTSGDAISSTNNAMGTVIMSTQYNSNQNPFTSKQQMLEQEYASDTKPCNDQIHPIECSRHDSPLSTLYVSSNNTANPDSPEFYNLGQFQLATQGMQANNVTVGELWCSYEIEFLKPQLDVGSSSQTLGVLSSHLSSTSPASGAPFNGMQLKANSNISFSSAASATQLIISGGQFQAGDNLLFVYQVSGTAGAQVAPAFTVGLNAVIRNFWNSDVNGFISSQATTGGSTLICMVMLDVLNTGQISLNLTGGTFTGAGTADVFVTQTNGALDA